MDWPAAITALDYGHLPCSSSEDHVLRIVASLADGIPVALRDVLSGLDPLNSDRVVAAIRHTTGQPTP